MITVYETQRTKDLNQDMELDDVILNDEYKYDTFDDLLDHLLTSMNTNDKISHKDNVLTIGDKEFTITVYDAPMEITDMTIKMLSINQAVEKYKNKDVTLVEYGGNKQYLDVRNHKQSTYDSVVKLTDNWNVEHITPLFVNGEMKDPAKYIASELSKLPDHSQSLAHKIDTSKIHQHHDFANAIEQLNKNELQL